MPDFKLYYWITLIKTEWCWHRNRHEDQWNRTDDPDTNPHNYSHLILDKWAQAMHCSKTGVGNKGIGLWAHDKSESTQGRGEDR
jgi:hypothetical protein